VFILAILVLFIGGGLTLFAWRAPMLKQGGLFAPVSREGALVFNNLFLTTACLTVFVGTLYPLALEALTGDKISVGAPFFNATFAPLCVPLLFAVPFGPLLAWKRGDLFGAAQRLTAAFGIALLAIAMSFAMAYGVSVLAPFAIGLAVFVMAGAVTDIVERIALLRQPLSISLARARGLPRSAWGTGIAHFALGVMLLGVTFEATFGTERIAAVQPAQTVSLAGYDLTFDGLVSRTGPNYREVVGHFTVREGGNVIGVMDPSKRSFTARGSSTTEAALLTRGFSQLYLSLGDPTAQGGVAIRLYHKPLVLLIWLGPAIMALGGLLSLSDRRLRVGAPRPARRAAAQAVG
jgi:cytochrome c-type biogenesis protein CcmF